VPSAFGETSAALDGYDVRRRYDCGSSTADRNPRGRLPFTSSCRTRWRASRWLGSTALRRPTTACRWPRG